MSNIFRPFEAEWRGQKVTIPANRIMGLLHVIEQVTPLVKLSRIIQAAFMDWESAPQAQISRVYAEVLRYGGVTVTEEEVYDGLFADTEKQAAILIGFATLQQIITPKSVLERIEKKTGGESKKPNRQARRAAASLSSNGSEPRVRRSRKAASA